jgi:hypothetical protein
MPEQRRQTRHRVAVTVSLAVDGEAAERVITNLSLGGAHVTHDPRLQHGTRVELTFHVPTQPEPIVIGGAVRWADDGGAGIQLDGLRAKEVWSLNKFFDTLS